MSHYYDELNLIIVCWVTNPNNDEYLQTIVEYFRLVDDVPRDPDVSSDKNDKHINSNGIYEPNELFMKSVFGIPTPTDPQTLLDSDELVLYVHTENIVPKNQLECLRYLIGIATHIHMYRTMSNLTRIEFNHALSDLPRRFSEYLKHVSNTPSDQRKTC